MLYIVYMYIYTTYTLRRTVHLMCAQVDLVHCSEVLAQSQKASVFKQTQLLRRKSHPASVVDAN